MMFPTVMLVANVASVAVLWFGGHRVDSGEMQVGALTAYLSYLMQIVMSVMMGTFMMMMIPRVGGLRRPDHARCSTPTRRRCRRRRAGRRHAASAARCELRRRRVQLPRRRAPGAARRLLRRRGPARPSPIIGSTGAGKSTLVNLVPRLFDVTGGAVAGRRRRRTRPRARACSGRVIGLVPQKAYLFSGTVALQPAHGKPDATDEELWEALEIAQADDFVAAMPEGLDAPIAQGGTNVSGGQRQRLAIARAVVRRPEIYLFDDSFSALDLATDARLRAALRPVTGTRRSCSSPSGCRRSATPT